MIGGSTFPVSHTVKGSCLISTFSNNLINIWCSISKSVNHVFDKVSNVSLGFWSVNFIFVFKLWSENVLQSFALPVCWKIAKNANISKCQIKRSNFGQNFMKSLILNSEGERYYRDDVVLSGQWAQLVAHRFYFFSSHFTNAGVIDRLSEAER